MNSLDQLKKEAEERYGKRCDEYDTKCFVCRIWEMFDKFYQMGQENPPVGIEAVYGFEAGKLEGLSRGAEIAKECLYECAEHGLESKLECLDCNDQINVNMMLRTAIDAIEREKI